MRERIVNWLTIHNLSPAFLLRYMISGILTFLAQCVAFLSLRNLIGSEWASGVDSVTGIVVNYVLSKHWVFESGHGNQVRDAALFVLANGIGIVMTVVGMKVGAAFLGWNEIVMRLSLGVLSFLVVLAFKRFVIWNPKRLNK